MESLIKLQATSDSRLVKNIKRKRDLVLAGDPSHERISATILCDSGVMWGAFGGGVVTGLEECGLTNVFDYAVGVSAGAPNLAYFLARQTRLGTAIYYEDLVDNQFINFTRIKKVVDLDLLEEVFRGERGHKKLDVDAVKSSRTKLLIAVTNSQNGQREFIDTQDPKVDVVSAIKASCAIPIVYNRSVEINGVEYSDGNSAAPLPIDYAIDNLKSDNILVILQKPFNYQSGVITKLIEFILARKFIRNPEVRQAFVSRHSNSFKILEDLDHLDNSINVGFIAMESADVSKYSMNSQKLRNLAMLGEQKAMEIFG